MIIFVFKAIINQIIILRKSMGNEGICTQSKDTQDKFEQIVLCGNQSQFKNSTTINIINNIPMIHGPPLNFNKSGTFDKVQKSAAEFCLHNQLDRSFIPLVARIIAYGHHNIFRAYQKIRFQREHFLEELKYIDFQFMDSLYHNFILGEKEQHSYVSTPINIISQEGINKEQASKYLDVGRKAMKNKEVGIILLCAGSSSRFQSQHKFLYPLNMKSQKTILELYFERIRKNFSIPEGNLANVTILIACNAHNRFLIEQYLKEKRYFGFNISKIRYLTVRSLPVLDPNGKICLTFQNKIVERPAGTAKCIEEFFNSGCYNFFKSENISIVHIVGCQNLGQSPGNPLHIGYLLHHELQLLGKCVDSLYPHEGFIRFVSAKTKNYVLSPEGIARIIGAKSQQVLQKCPVAMNSLICKLQQLKDIIKDYENSMFLSKQFRAIFASQNYYDFLKEKPLIKDKIIYFEKDIQHFLSCSSKYRIIKIPRQDFIPVLTKNQQYSLKQASKQLIQLHQRHIQSSNFH